MKKKFIFAVLVTAMVSVFGACGADKTPSANAETPVTVEAANYVTLGNYKNLGVVMQPEAVEEATVLEQLAGVYAAYASKENGSVDRAIILGDTANIDYMGKLDGVAFAGGTAQDTNLAIGSGQFIAGFEDGLVGVKPGETVDLPLQFPTGYQNEELAGKNVIFTVTVNYVIPGNEKEMKDSVPASIVADGISFQTVADLKSYLREQLELQAQTVYEANIKDELLRALVEQSEFKNLSEELVQQYADIMKSDLQRISTNYSIGVDEYTSILYGMTSEEFINTYAVEKAKQEIACQALAMEAGLTVDDAELEKTLEEYVVTYEYGTMENLLKDMPREQWRSYITVEKVADYLVENNQ